MPYFEGERDIEKQYPGITEETFGKAAFLC